MKKIITCYLITILLFIVFSYLFIDPNLIYLKFLYSGLALTAMPVVTMVYIIFTIFFFLFYVYFLKTAGKGKITKKTGKTLLGISCILILSYPAILSFDIFNYMATSDVLYFYHENPYLVMPMEFKGDTMLLFTRAANKYALYGPSWLGLSAIPYFLGIKSFIMTIFLFKCLTAVFYLGITYMIYKISKSIVSAAFFALNPLVLLEVLVSGHNDTVMMFFALCSFYLLHKKMMFSSFILITLSILIKYATVFLLPVYLFDFYKQIRGHKIDQNRIWLLISAVMFLIFMFSFIREEIYPWYAVWFLPFVALLSGYKKLKILTIALTFGLTLYYIPYMLLGTYAFPVNVLKIVFSSFPVVITAVYLVVSKYAKSR